MDDRVERGVRATALVAGLLALLALVALASGGGRPQSSGRTDVGAVAEIRDVIMSVGATLWVLAFAAIVVAAWRLRVPRGDAPQPRGLGQLIAFMLLMGIVVWVFRYQAELRPPGGEEAFGPEVVEARPIPLREDPEAIPPAEFRWDVAIAVAAMVAAAAAGVGVLVARRRRGLEGRSPRDEAAAELAALVEGTLADVRREADPRRAVIAAYAQMEHVLARHGLPRRPAEAPFEYLGRMLRELRVRASSALALTELFERARFSRHDIDASMRDEAIEALGAVRDDLRAAT